MVLTVFDGDAKVDKSKYLINISREFLGNPSWAFSYILTVPAHKSQDDNRCSNDDFLCFFDQLSGAKHSPLSSQEFSRGAL